MRPRAEIHGRGLCTEALHELTLQASHPSGGKPQKCFTIGGISSSEVNTEVSVPSSLT